MSETIQIPSREVLNRPFDWANRASIENIPHDVKPVVDDVIQAMVEVYGNVPGALYLDGSVVLGGFRKGASDIDGVWISRDKLADDHQKRRQERLQSINLRGVVGYVDFIAMPESEISDPDRRSTVFACGFNGIKVYGDLNPQLDNYVPKTIADYITCMFAQFKRALRIAQEKGYNTDTVLELTPRSIAKRNARATYYRAYSAGLVPYEQSMSVMSDLLRDKGLHEDAQLFEDMQSKSRRTLSDQEKDEILKIGKQFAEYFMSIISANDSPYAKWVKQIIDQQ